MKQLLDIPHPFLSVEDFRRRVGGRIARLIHRLVGKYPRLAKGCGRERMLVALSVAWSMTSAARDGNQDLLYHIDEALSPCHRMGCLMEPPMGCVTVEGCPFFLAEAEQGMRSFLWDGFAIFIDQEGIGHISQAFFDLADAYQRNAYSVMGEENLGEEETAEEEKDFEEENLAVKILEEEKLKEKNLAVNNLKEQTDEKILLEQRNEWNAECFLIRQKSEANAEYCSKEQEDDLLADLVDNILLLETPSAAEGMSAALDRYCVEAELHDKARQAAIEQARRLHYCIDRQKTTEHNNKLKIQKGQQTMGDIYHIQGDFVKGDKVMGNKYVGVACKEGEAEEEQLKAALSQLMDEEDADGKPLFHNQSQWFAVYRILTDDYGWRDGALSDFCRRINALGTEWQVPCKVDGIKKVNQTAPFYKAFSEGQPQGSQTAYDRQQKVARKFRELMQEAAAG